jgi:transposase
LDTYPIAAQSLEKFYYIDGIQFERHYKDHLSDFKRWKAGEHAEEWLIFPQNTGAHLSIDETSLSNGDLYTIVTNKAAQGRKGALVAIIEGTASDKVIEILEKIPQDKRNQVEEVTLDMAESMHRIVRRCFPNAIRVIDRFHVQKLAYDALQEIRIAHRWDAINEETNAMEQAKLAEIKHVPLILENGDSKKQLLARSRYLLFKSAEKWTAKQKHRAKILFEWYPDIKKAYSLTHSLRMIFSKNTIKDAARLSLARWYNQVNDSGFKSFNTISATIYEHYDEILNFFINRSTNASAESFNAKIKAFRTSLRGVSDMKFFLFRLSSVAFKLAE